MKRNMDPSDSAYNSINDNKNVIGTNVTLRPENPQLNGLNQTNRNIYIADKTELQKILHTVSLLTDSKVSDNNTENIQPKNKGKRKISVSSDGEEVQIIDVVVYDLQNNSSNNLTVMSTNTPTQMCSSTSEDIEAVEFLNGTESKKTPEKVLKSDSEECIMSVSSLETNSKPVISTINEVDLESSCSEICSVDVIETIKITDNEILSSSALCNEIVDLTSEIENNNPEGDVEIVSEEVSKNNLFDEYFTYDIEYDFSHTPSQITGSFKEFKTGRENNFTRGCKWAPDGSCILTCSNDNKLRIFNLPSQLWDYSPYEDISELEVALKIGEGDLIYDYCWYPLMNSNDASTCCLVSTSRKSTVHMWDGYTGELRCSYRSFNHLDELVTPHSLSFDTDGQRIFCGFQNIIRVFDVNRPGRLCEERPTYAHKTGQCGIISCFAFTSADKNISAAGSYKSTIGLYSEPYGEFSCLLQGQANGITHLQFSPDGKYLYSGARKDPEILCWDLRNLGTVLFSLRRTVETNQRMYFDISKCGKYVVSGNQNGVITFWDVTKEPKIINENDFSVLIPVHYFMGHHDCVNGISLHPSYPILCSSSGQRKFPILMDDDSDAIFSPETEKQDNSLRLWWIGKSVK